MQTILSPLGLLSISCAIIAATAVIALWFGTIKASRLVIRLGSVVQVRPDRSCGQYSGCIGVVVDESNGSSEFHVVFENVSVIESRSYARFKPSDLVPYGVCRFVNTSWVGDEDGEWVDVDDQAAREEQADSKEKVYE